MNRVEWLDALRNDVMFGVRQLRKNPAFSLIAMLTLALGIGANSAIFSVVYNVLLRPLPYANAERIYTFEERNGSGSMCCLPFGNFDMWRRNATGLEAIVVFWGVGSLTLSGQGDPTPISTWHASAGYWKTLFIPPVLGRYFTEAEDHEGGPQVAVLSYALWQNRFGGDRAIVGRTITLNGIQQTVIGVAAPEYVLTPPAERIWVPLAPESWRLSDFADHELRVYGLLRRGVSLQTVVQQLTQIETALAREHPHSGYDGGVIATSELDFVVGAHRTTLYMLLGAVVLVLLIACGNIANLLLARATVRRPEIAIRGALGATRGRIILQLLVESLLLALGGAVIGLGIAIAGTRFLVSSPAIIPRLQTTTVNAAVLLFTLALAVLCAIIFGLVPALRSARLDLQQTLRDGGRELRGAAREHLRRALVVSELCVAQVLLIGAGLLIRSSMRLEAVPPGFDPHNLLAMYITLPDARYRSSAQRESAFEQIESAIASVPGVKSVGRTLVAPIYGFGWDWTAFREGSNGHDEGAVDANMRSASPTYFATLGVRLLRGRAFTRADVANGPHVAIISRGLARRLWGDADPIGKRIADGSGKNPDWKEVVGVIDDMHARGLSDPPPFELYRPSTQWVNPSQTIIVRGAVSVTSLAPPIRRAVSAIDPLLSLSNVSTMEQAIGKELAMGRFTMLLLALLGGTGLVLAVVGVYGVIAYFVTMRTHELGVRMALGASGSAVRWMVVKQGFALAALGGAIGLAAAFFAARVMQGMVYGVTVHDPITFAAVAAILVVVAVAASVVPSRRATRIDPLEALRA